MKIFHKKLEEYKDPPKEKDRKDFDQVFFNRKRINQDIIDNSHIYLVSFEDGATEENLKFLEQHQMYIGDVFDFKKGPDKVTICAYLPMDMDYLLDEIKKHKRLTRCEKDQEAVLHAS